MKVIISPAKNMKPDKAASLPVSLPHYIEETKQIVQALRTYTPFDLEVLMKINPALALDSADRIYTMHFDKKGTSALETYDGIQYKYMDPLSFTETERQFAQDTVRILSGAYGILKPYDSIYEYRLEMLTKLEVGGHKNLYRYWSDFLYQELVKEDSTIINLASAEYSKCIKRYVEPSVRFITCTFQVKRKGVYKTLATAAKMARGQMIRYIVTNQIQDPVQLTQFDTDGYQFCEALSTEQELVFLQS